MRLDIPDSFDVGRLLEVLFQEARRQNHRVAGHYVNEDLVASLVPIVTRSNVIPFTSKRAAPEGSPQSSGAA